MCLIKELSTLIDENLLGPMEYSFNCNVTSKCPLYAFAVVKTASNKSLYILQVEIKFRLILM